LQCPLSVARDQHDRRTRLSQHKCCPRAYSAACSGHNRYFALKLTHFRSLARVGLFANVGVAQMVYRIGGL
jgi:hypothetical protein